MCVYLWHTHTYEWQRKILLNFLSSSSFVVVVVVVFRHHYPYACKIHLNYMCTYAYYNDWNPSFIQSLTHTHQVLIFIYLFYERIFLKNIFSIEIFVSIYVLSSSSRKIYIILLFTEICSLLLFLSTFAYTDTNIHMRNLKFCISSGTKCNWSSFIYGTSNFLML